MDRRDELRADQADSHRALHGANSGCPPSTAPSEGSIRGDFGRPHIAAGWQERCDNMGQIGGTDKNGTDDCTVASARRNGFYFPDKWRQERQAWTAK